MEFTTPDFKSSSSDFGHLFCRVGGGGQGRGWWIMKSMHPPTHTHDNDNRRRRRRRDVVNVLCVLSRIMRWKTSRIIVFLPLKHGNPWRICILVRGCQTRRYNGMPLITWGCKLPKISHGNLDSALSAKNNKPWITSWCCAHQKGLRQAVADGDTHNEEAEKKSDRGVENREIDIPGTVAE